MSVLFGHRTHVALYKHHVMPSKYFKAFPEHFSNWQNSKKDFWLRFLKMCVYYFSCILCLEKNQELATRNAWVFLVLSKHVLKINLCEA